jgi:hypothetical protein
MFSIRILAVMLGLTVAAAGCSPTRGRGGSDDDDNDDNDSWTLDIVNETGITLEIVMHRPCPSTEVEDWNEVPLPAGGIPTGDHHRAGLPTPSCYALSGEGEGGFCFVSGTTGSLELGEQYVWTVGEDDLLCAG